MEGCSVLDLGSGAGIDCFILSKLVGASGRVIGVDMTQEQVYYDGTDYSSCTVHVPQYTSFAYSYLWSLSINVVATFSQIVLITYYTPT